MDLFLQNVSACWNYRSVPLKCFRLLELWICSFKMFPLAGTMDLFLSACWNYGSVALKRFRLLELWICSFKIFPLAGTLLELFICSFKIVLLAGTSPKKFGNFLLFTERVPLELTLTAWVQGCLEPPNWAIFSL